MPGTLEVTWNKFTRELTFGRIAGNFAKRGETLTLAVTALDEDEEPATGIPANTIATIKPVNKYGPNATLVRWENFSQSGSTNVWTASATLNSAEITTLLGVIEEKKNCVMDFAGDGGASSDTLAIVLENNVTRDDDAAPTVLISRSDFLVTNGTGLLVNVGLGILQTGASVAAQTSIALTNNATNYVQLNSSGVASVNTSGFSDGYSPLAVVLTSAGVITSNSDRRPWIDVKNPSSGGAWGSITGTLSNQTDLQAALDAKGTVTHTAGALTLNSLIVGNGTADIKVATTGSGALPALGNTVNTSGGFVTFDGTMGDALADSFTVNNVLIVNGSIAVGDITINSATGIVTATGFSGPLTGNASTATLAATVTVANEAADTTCFPLFATAATGSLGVKSNAALTFNSSNGTLATTTMNAGAFTFGTGAQASTIIPGQASLVGTLYLYDSATSPVIFTTITNSQISFSQGGSLTYQTLTLGVAASATGSVVLNGATSGAVTVKPADAAGTWSMTLPTTGGTNGYFLQTNGSGVTTWAAASSFDPASPGAIGGTTPSTVAMTGGTFTLDFKSTTAFATPSALSATQFTAFASTVSGATLMGYGTTNDVSLKNRAGTTVLGVGPNTTTVTCAGIVTTPEGTSNGFANATDTTSKIAFASGNQIYFYASAIRGFRILPDYPSGTGIGFISLNGNFKWNNPSEFYDSVTCAAALITTPEALASALNAGAAVSVATTSTGLAINGTNALTLANGTNGQIKTIVCTAVTAAGTATLTPTTANGFTAVAFTAAGQTLTLQYFTTGGWVILSVRGATPA